MNNKNSAKKVNVIIITYNSEKFIERCIDSLIAQEYPKEDYSITIVDNNSEDSTLDILASLSKSDFISGSRLNMRIIKNPANHGFSRANNSALKEERLDYALLLNHDSWIEKDFLKSMVSVMESKKTIGVCGAAEHPYESKLDLMRKTEQVNWVGCGATMFRMRALEQTGLFDENYFMYNEDIDICLRMRLKGWQVYYTPKGVWHHYGWGRELNVGDSRIINSSLSRIYLLIKFASLRQIVRSLRIYSQRRYNKNKEPSKDNSIFNKEYLKRQITPGKLACLIRIIMRAPLYVLKGAFNRMRIRRIKGFSHKIADELIRETDKSFYMK